ncbi:conserved Plasmodium protein, unknown function [Plasmodium gaboni]|uniref:Uncharacterized protein n=1 Tax=Plasmodium gaboni TaxID=647221 RepID=A0ABY1UK73_9APIC|nr:conserved Plasmodium protein, unknown function [Plasmodium gaboni]
MSSVYGIEQLNDILKYNIEGNKRKEKKKNSNHDIKIEEKEKRDNDNENEKYLNKSKLIGKKYIDKVINECNNIYINYYQYNNKRYNHIYNIYDNKNYNDIEYKQYKNLNIDNNICKVKGEHLYQGTAGITNEIIIETLNTNEECIYIENCILEVYIKRKDHVDKLNYNKNEYTSSQSYNNNNNNNNNMYSKFINNNLFNKYLYDKHCSLININHNKYNINANFSNYKNVGQYSSKQNEHNYDTYQPCHDEMEYYPPNVRNNEPIYGKYSNGINTHQNKYHEIDTHQNKYHEIDTHQNKYHEIDTHQNKYHEIDTHQNKSHEINTHNNQNKKKNTNCIKKKDFFNNHAHHHYNNNITYNDTMKDGYLNNNLEYDEESNKLIKDSLKCNVRDLKNGTYIITYNLRKCGYYYLSIFYNKKHIAESPYLIEIKASQAYAPNCVIYKNDITNKLIIPYDTSEEILSYDNNTSSFYDNPCDSNVSCESPLHHVSIKTHQKDDKDSEKKKKKMHLLKFTKEEEEEELNKTFNNFYIQCYDAYENKICKGGDILEVEGIGDIKIINIEDLNNGTYEVIYKYIKNNIENNNNNNNNSYENMYREIHVTLNKVHIKGSPFRIIFKNDNNMYYINKLKNILQIEDYNINSFKLIERIINIIKSYNHIKENFIINDENINCLLYSDPFMNINSHYYNKKELHDILKKVDTQLLSLMSIPMKEQLFNYIKYINNDNKIAHLKILLYKDLIYQLGYILKNINNFYHSFQKDMQDLKTKRILQHQIIKEANIMYESLRDKNIHTLPFNFSINDMNIYKENLTNKKKYLLQKHNTLVKKYKDIKMKEKQFLKDRKQITNELTNKYKLHQYVYQRSTNALQEINTHLKKKTIQSIKEYAAYEQKFVSLKSDMQKTLK